MNYVSVPYLVFQKKGEYGPASISLENYSSTNFKEEYLIEKGSNTSVNGMEIKSNYVDVKSILYGQLYGKMSVK